MKVRGCTVESVELVRISIEGEPHPEGFPNCPNDRGLVSDLLNWIVEANIRRYIRGGMSGGGCFIGYFTHEEAKKVMVWLGKEGKKYDEGNPVVDSE